MSPRPSAPKRPVAKSRKPQDPMRQLQRHVNKVMELVDVILDSVKGIETRLDALDGDHAAMLESLTAQMGVAVAVEARLTDLETRVTGVPSQDSPVEIGDAVPAEDVT